MTDFTKEAENRLKETLELNDVDLCTVLCVANTRIRRLTDEKDSNMDRRARKTPEEIADKVWSEHGILGNIDHEAHCLLDMDWEDFVEWSELPLPKGRGF